LLRALVLLLASVTSAGATWFVASIDAAAPTTAVTPNPSACDRKGVVVVACAKVARPYTFAAGTVIFSGPRAGRVFTGAYAWVRGSQQTKAWTIACEAEIGGRLTWTGGRPRAGSLYFARGARLKPIIHRYYTTPDENGDVFLSRVTCGWRIPPSAAGKLLSLIWHTASPRCEDEFTCKPWGFDFDFGNGSDTACTGTTWRVRRHDAANGVELKKYPAC
jgi:hypothetical protein